MNSEAPLRIEILRSPEEILQLRDSWNQLVLENSGTVEQLDLTNSYEWAVSLWESHVQTEAPTVMVLWKDKEIVGLMPLRTFRRSIRAISCRKLSSRSPSSIRAEQVSCSEILNRTCSLPC